MSAMTAGWTDKQLASLYHIIERKQEQFEPHSTEHWCLADALKAIELADIHVEKRQREQAA